VVTDGMDRLSDGAKIKISAPKSGKPAAAGSAPAPAASSASAQQRGGQRRTSSTAVASHIS